MRLVFVLVFGKILGHSDQLAPDIVPLLQHSFRTTRSRGFFLVLATCGQHGGAHHDEGNCE